MNDLLSFSDVIREIIRLKGVDVLKNDRLFLAMFSDLAPNMTLENKIIKRICAENGLSRFYSLVVNEYHSSKNSTIDAIILFLKEELGFSDEWTRKAILAFCEALDIPFNYSEKEKMNTKSIPVKCPALSDKKEESKDTTAFDNTSKTTTLNNATVLETDKDQKKKTGYYTVIFGLVLGLLVWYFISHNTQNKENSVLMKSEQTTVSNNDYSANRDNVSVDDVQYWGIITSTYSEGIAIHPEPKKDSEVLGRIPYQEVFPIYFIEPNTTYGYTNYNGIVGYINLDYAEIYDSEIDNERELIDYGIYKDGHGISSYEYVLPDSDSRYLTRDDVSNLTLRGVNYAKNEIYARYGRDFKSQELRNFFASRDWYYVSYSVSDETDKKITGMFNDYEKENSKFLDAIEKEMGTYNLQ